MTLEIAAQLAAIGAFVVVLIALALEVYVRFFRKHMQRLVEILSKAEMFLEKHQKKNEEQENLK